MLTVAATTLEEELEASLSGELLVGPALPPEDSLAADDDTSPGDDEALLGEALLDGGGIGTLSYGGDPYGGDGDPYGGNGDPYGGENNPPVAEDDHYLTVAGETLQVDAAAGVLANDWDPDDDPLTAVLYADVQDGSLTLNADGSFSYTPDAGFTGADSFFYRAYDGEDYSDVAEVTIEVYAGWVVAEDDLFEVAHGRALVVSAAGVLENDVAVSGEALSANLEQGPTWGALTLNSDGSFSYTPDAGFVGTDQFTYTATDGTHISNVATVTVEVTNAAPWSTDDFYRLSHGRTLTVDAPGVLANDVDREGDPMTATLVGSPPARHAPVPSGRLLHLHAQRRLHRQRHLHLPGERRAGRGRSGHGDHRGNERRPAGRRQPLLPSGQRRPCSRRPGLSGQRLGCRRR